MSHIFLERILDPKGKRDIIGATAKMLMGSMDGWLTYQQ